MLETFIYIGLTLIVSFFFGAGISFLILPKELQQYRLWLSPWIFFFLTILILGFFTFSGFSTSTVAVYLLSVLFLINLYVYLIKNEFFAFNLKTDVIITTTILISIILNISPLIKKEHLLTTISLGNNDVVAYATSADYLVHYSIFESFFTKVSLPISDLFHLGGRWGPPILESFFLYIFSLKGYQFTYVFEVIIYALTIPLVYILFQILYKKSYTGLTILSILFIFNANLLYMLYHNFFGVVMFLGISLCLLIGIFSYLPKVKIATTYFNRNDLFLVICFSVLYSCYHEGIIFITAPMLLYMGYKFFLKDEFAVYLYKLLKILCGVILVSSISVINAIVFDYKQAFGGYRGGEIGWQVFRTYLPYANPFEMMGFYSIHSFEPLALPLAIFSSLVIVAVILYGLSKSKDKVLSSLYLFIFISFLYLYGPYSKHFFNYNRVLTYTLPFFIVLFTIGITELIDKRKKLWFLVIIFLLLEISSGLKLNKKLLQEYKSVSKAFISLQTGPFLEVSEPVYTSNYISNFVPIWNTVWTEYFIYPTVYRGKTNQPKQISDSSLILTAKSITSSGATKPLYKEIIWENEYFRLGRICKKNDCLLSSNRDLSLIQIGENDYEDSLFINGWDRREGNVKWANNSNASLKLISKDEKESIIIEALTLSEPQVMDIFVDEVYVGKIQITKTWKKQSLAFVQPLQPGIHIVSFKFSNLYTPDRILHNNDMRSLAAQFKLIKLN